MEAKLEAIKAAWERIAGFAVCEYRPEMGGSESTNRVVISYPDFAKAIDAYKAMGEITRLLNFKGD